MTGSPERQEAAAAQSPPPFRDLDRLTQYLRVLLLVGLALSLLGVWSGWLQLELLVRGDYSDEEAANDSRESLIGMLALLVLFSTVFAFGRWIYLAHKNLPVLGAERPDVTPGWAVGWFFVPIACLWKPYTAMRTLWQASNRPVRWDLEDTPLFLAVWWTLWLIAGAVSQIVVRMQLRAETVEELELVTRIALASNVLDAPLAVAAWTVVGRIWAAQLSQHERRGQTPSPNIAAEV